MRRDHPRFGDVQFVQSWETLWLPEAEDVADGVDDDGGQGDEEGVWITKDAEGAKGAKGLGDEALPAGVARLCRQRAL